MSEILSDLHRAKSFLRQCNQRSLQAHWFAYESLAATEPLKDHPLPLNDRGHIAWEKGRSVLWLGQDLILPETWNGYPLGGLTAKLALTWWAEEAIVFVNGQPMQEGDLFDCSTRIILTDRVQGGEGFRIRLRLVSPGHDPGALVKSQLELEDLRDGSSPEPSWLAAELEVVETYLQSHRSQSYSSHRSQEISALEQFCHPLLEQMNYPWGDLQYTVNTLREHYLQHWGEDIKQRHIYLLGHAHLDLAWLWSVAETWAAAERTFRSVLALQQDFPELIFAHSSPVLYHWLEQHRPDLFQAIYQGIQRGQWETIAGLWVEPDTILPSGESLLRQVLYGQQYVQNHLGQRNRVAWLPDSFGFSGQLPQILKQGGIDWFITQKLTWNDTNTFPHALFQWQSPDGTIALALMSAPIGQGIDPLAMMQGAMAWEQATGLQDYLWLPGVGDHGGGPSRDMLETARRWQTSPCFPQLGFSRLHDYLDRLERHLDRTALPLWNQDLYLELHRGCYTSHGDQKQWNRQLEDLLYRAELWATWAQILADQPFPHQALEQAWKLVLFNQFHDILPGSSIPEVFEQANQEWQQAKDLAEGILNQSLHSISDRISPASPLAQRQGITIVVFRGQGLGDGEQSLITQNSSLKTHHSSLIITIPSTLLPTRDRPCQAWDIEGKVLTTQALESKELLVLLSERSGVGYTQLHLQGIPEDSDQLSENQLSEDQLLENQLLENQSLDLQALDLQPLHYPVTVEITETHYHLENSKLRVTIDRGTGQIEQLYSHILQRNLLKAPGNQLQCFQDQGQYWDAWNIDPDYEKHPLTPPQLVSCEVVDQGALRCSVRVCYQFQHSTIEQNYCLDYEIPWLTIQTQVNWQADQVLLKVAFPWAFDRDDDPTHDLEKGIRNLKCVTESACGTVERSTHPSNAQEAAQWEIPMHRWMDLSISTPEENWGISVMNTGKYGADVKDSCLRLSLLRSPRWPDPYSDRGEHQFTYALYPHAGSWESAQTVAIAHRLNSPVSLIPLSSPSVLPKTLPSATTLLNLGDSSLCLMSFHPHVTQEGYVLRCYESAGQKTTLKLEVLEGIKINKIMPLTGLEMVDDRFPVDRFSDGVPEDLGLDNLFIVQPWQIRSWLLKLNT